jgi:hypothetical protein
MRGFFSAALCIAGFLVLVALSLLFKAALGRYVIVFLLAFVGFSFVVSLVAFLLFIFKVPLDTSHKE